MAKIKPVKVSPQFFRYWARRPEKWKSDKRISGASMYMKEGDHWTAADNRAGEFFVEAFPSEAQALDWLTHQGKTARQCGALS
ncbi:MAG: hypothetical protein JRN62_02515 [Nitrososphaerota archaeon]|nr:hypothetical protein [Nitrososphaerota archaeon]MDG6948875.1 hypothetical protein [Nitrososphaerota archaeon]